MFDTGFETIVPIAVDIDYPTIDAGFRHVTVLEETGFDVSNVNTTIECFHCALCGNGGESVSGIVIDLNVMRIGTFPTRTTIENVRRIGHFGYRGDGGNCVGIFLLDTDFRSAVQGQCAR